LELKLLNGILERDTEIIGQMDPFIIMEYEGLRFKSNVIKNGGKTPEWNQTFQIPISSPDGNIKI